MIVNSSSRFVFLFTQTVSALLMVNACRAEVDWHPDKTRVFAVGVLEWQNPNVWPGMANAQHQRRVVELV